MRVILLLLLICTLNIVLSQRVINSRIFYLPEFCTSSDEPSTPTPKIFCPEDTNQSYSGGFIVKEDQCMFIRFLSMYPTTFHVSSDSKSIIEKSYIIHDYYCQADSNSTSYTIGECHENCSHDGNQAYKFELTVTDELIIPDNAILTIDSASYKCESDWKTSYNFISYTNTMTCNNNQFGGSYILDCDGNSITGYNYNCLNCQCNPTISHTPLQTDSCNYYQVCTK